MADPSADFSVTKALAGVLGSFVSMRFVPGTVLERMTMGAGGAALSYYAATPAAVWFGMQSAEGLVGFLIGLFGMSLVSKFYEVIAALDAKTMASDLWETVKRKLKA